MQYDLIPSAEPRGREGKIYVFYYILPRGGIYLDPRGKNLQFPIARGGMYP